MTMDPGDDGFAAGEALIRELCNASGPDEQRDALDGVWDFLNRLTERGRNEDALRLADHLLAWQLERDPEQALDEAAEEIAYTMLQRAAVLRNLDRLPEAVAQRDDLLRRYGKSFETGPAPLHGYLAEALYRKGRDLLSLGRWLEALAVFDELVANEPAVLDDDRWWVASARAARGDALDGLGDKPGAAEAYAEAIAVLGDDDDPEVLAVVQRTMANRGQVLARLGRTDEAFEVFDDLIAVPEPVAPKSVANVYYHKAYWLADRRDFEAAIATADAATQRFGLSDDPDIRVCVAGCLNEKIYALRGLGRKDAAALVADQLVDRFGADLDPAIEKLVAPHAHRLGRGRTRLRFFGLG